MLGRLRDSGPWTGVAVWLVAVQGLVVSALLAGHDPLDQVVWFRPDTVLFATIADDGYALASCPGSTTELCGNVLVLPGYPLVAALADVLVPLPTALVLVPWAFGLATLVLLSRTFLRDVRWPIAAGTLALAAFWPGQAFLFTALQLSLLVFFSTVWLWSLTERRWPLAGFAAAGALVTDPLGLLLVPLAAGWVLATRAGAPPRAVAMRLGAALGPALAGGALVFLLMLIETDRWSSWLDVQRQLPRDVQLPLVTLSERIEPLFAGGFDFATEPAAAQALLVAVIVVVLVGWVVRLGARATPADRLAAAFMTVLWLFPLTFTGQVAHWRMEVALLPAVVIARRLPAPLTFLLAGTALWVSVLVARMVFAGALP